MNALRRAWRWVTRASDVDGVGGGEMSAKPEEWRASAEQTNARHTWLDIDVDITEAATGITKRSTHSCFIEDGQDTPYLGAWIDGNYSCDCNRASVFHGEFRDEPCGDSRYRIRIINPVSGRVLYSDEVLASRPCEAKLGGDMGEPTANVSRINEYKQ